MMTLARHMFIDGERAVRALEALQPLAQLVARLHVARVFLLSDLTKLRDWDTTLALWGPGSCSLDAWWLARRTHHLPR